MAARKVPSRASTSNSTITIPQRMIAIDLGNCYTRIGIRAQDSVDIIPDERGCLKTPSIISFTDNGALVGHVAEVVPRSTNTVYDFRRLLGRDLSEPEMQDDIKRWLFKVSEKNDGVAISVTVNNEIIHYTPEDIVALFLAKIKENAETFIDESVNHAILVVPSYYSDAQRSATKAAARSAGLEVRLVNDYVAAGIAYGLPRSTGSLNFLILSIGSATCSAVIGNVEGEIIELVSRADDFNLGGRDFDDRIVEHLAGIYEAQTGTNVSGDAEAMKKLRKAAVSAKEALSSDSEDSVPVLIESLEGGNKFEEIITIAQFEELCGSLFDSAIKCVEQALGDCRLQKEDIGEVILEGGSTRIRRIRQLIRDFFDGKEPRTSIDPEETLVHGAALMHDNDAAPPLQRMCTLTPNPFMIGIAAPGETFTKVLEPTYLLPFWRTVSISTPETTVKVYEGYADSVSNNKLICELELPRSPDIQEVRGFNVTLHLDEDFQLRVTATDQDTRLSSITAVSLNRSSEEVARSMAEHEKYQSRKHAEALTRLNVFVDSLQRRLGEAEVEGKKVRKSKKKKVRRKNDDEAKLMILLAVEDVEVWMEYVSQDASVSQVEEKLSDLKNMVEAYKW